MVTYMLNVVYFHPSVIPLKSMSHMNDVWPYAFSFTKFYDPVSLPSLFESCIYSHLICIIAEAISQKELLKRQHWIYLTNYLSSPKHNYLCPRCVNIVLTGDFETSRYIEKSWWFYSKWSDGICYLDTALQTSLIKASLWI